MSKADLLFLVTLASIPIQLGRFFFFEHSFVLGIPIDYRAPALYFSDITVILFLTAAIIENRKVLKLIFKAYKPYILAAFTLTAYLFFSSLTTQSKEASLPFNLKVLEFVLLSIFAANAMEKSHIRKKALSVLQFSVLWQSALIGAQFINQGSLGLRILGERTFDSTTVQIAHSRLFGFQLLRPYGTFPHPNVAAAYLALSAVILASAKRLAPVFASILAILLTFSKSALAILAIGAFFSAKSLQRTVVFLALALGFGIFVALQTATYQIATIAERLLLSQAALDIALISPLFGIGSNNFILELSKLNLYSLSETRLLQPVHNVFLLILAENGLAGLVIFTVLLLTLTKYLNSKTKILLFTALLLYLSVDHFLWTLQQGKLILWFMFAYFLTGAKKSPKGPKVFK